MGLRFCKSVEMLSNDAIGTVCDGFALIVTDSNMSELNFEFYTELLEFSFVVFLISMNWLCYAVAVDIDFLEGLDLVTQSFGEKYSELCQSRAGTDDV